MTNYGYTENFKGMCITLGNIGEIYASLKDYKNAKKYYAKSKKIAKKYDNPRQLARTLTHLGLLHSLQQDYDSAMVYYRLALNICIKNNFPEIATGYNNIAKIYYRKGKIDSSYYLQQKSLRYAEKFQNWGIMVYSYCNIGTMEKDNGNYRKAKKYYEKAYHLVLKMNELNDKPKCLALLSEVNEHLGSYKLALAQYQEMTAINDSIFNASKSKEIGKLEASYEYEKQKTIDDAKNEKLVAVEKQKKEKQEIMTISTGIVLALVVIFLIFIFNRLQITKKQRNLIKNQKEIVEEKQQEILDSITYAKRIQSAILPPQKVVKEYLQNSFILYKPKDIVAGDFYWMESSERYTELVSTSNNCSQKQVQPNKRTVLFAACDCTGHGVPGAMVSVICNNGLNRAVREHHITDPGKILDKTREIVIQEFEKSEEDVKDGMDIALCSLEDNLPFEGKKSGMILKYAGANNPLWIVRKLTSEPHSKLVSSSIHQETKKQVQDDNYILYEVKPNKQAIGKVDNPQPFTTHTFKLQKGDTIYIFSDGYVDQFGGEKGKKLKARAFRDLLLSVQNKAMEEQKNIINKKFENWKGNLEQIDDVCIVGVRI